MTERRTIMFTKKLASLALAGLLTIGGTGVTAFAAEPTAPLAPEQPSISISFDKEAKAAELAEKATTMEAMALEFAEKGIAFEEAKAAMELKLAESGKTAEEINALLEQFTAKFDELKAAKGAEVAVKQAEREANTAARQEKGVVKGGQGTGDII